MRPRRVLVAGAGLAGLTAARELARGGLAVTIVDARDRTGGRAWTMREGFASGQYGELGGEFIDEDHREMRRLAREFGLELVRVLHGGFVQRFRGGDGRPHVDRGRGWRALDEAFAPLVRRYKAARGEPDAAAIREISAYSVRDWLRQADAPPDLHALADAFRGFFLADPEHLSALPLVELLAGGESPAQTPVYRIAGGVDQLVNALLHAAPVRLLLRHSVKRIDHAVDRVIVHVTDGEGLLQTMEADAAVIALPASTLSDVEISPSLPASQRHAINMLKYGCATKVIVQHGGDHFRERHARAFATDTALGAFWDSTEAQGAPAHPMLTFLAGGSASRLLRERVRTGGEAVLSDLCWLGLAGVRVFGMQAHTWEDDPLARGGYAYLDPAFDSAWLPLLSKRAGRLVFAGEHTSEERAGYMEGAVESGLRAATDLLKL